MPDPNPSQPPQTAPPWSLTTTATLCRVAAVAPTVAAAYFLVTSSTARTGMEYAVSTAFLALLALISLVFVLGARAIRQTGMLLAPRLLGVMLAIFGGVGTATTATRLADTGTGLVSVAVSALALIAGGGTAGAAAPGRRHCLGGTAPGVRGGQDRRGEAAGRLSQSWSIPCSMA